MKPGAFAPWFHTCFIPVSENRFHTPVSYPCEPLRFHTLVSAMFYTLFHALVRWFRTGFIPLREDFGSFRISFSMPVSNPVSSLVSYQVSYLFQFAGFIPGFIPVSYRFHSRFHTKVGFNDQVEVSCLTKCFFSQGIYIKY